MIAEQALYSLLSVASGVTGLVSTRIYPDAMPEGGDYPVIVYARIGTAPIPSVSNINFGADVTLSVGCWAETRTAADGVAAAVAAAVVGSAFNLTGREAGFDPETGLFAAIVTLEVFETP